VAILVTTISEVNKGRPLSAESIESQRGGFRSDEVVLDSLGSRWLAVARTGLSREVNNQ